MQPTSLARSLALLFLPVCLCAQYPSLSPQKDIFNSSIQITQAQQRLGGINSTLANNLALALNFERSNFAHGPVASDSFYLVPPGSAAAAPGALLKLQADANTSAYTLPPNTAISRILFQTESINGSKVPASAYVLWPYLARTQPDGKFPIVAWAHGTSGATGNCAPSQYRNLLYQFATVFELVAQGYVVVAPDYIGLGVTKDSQGRPLVHPYFGSPSHANDLVYSVQAAKSAFPSLSKQFVVMGHSQGGGAAWSAAVRQAQTPVDGYLGAVVGSPVTNFFSRADIFGAAGEGFRATYLARTFSDLYPPFQLEDILTPAGVGRLRLTDEIQGCFNTATQLLADAGLVRPNWTENYHVRAWNNLTDPAGKAIAGPMLVLQGEGDTSVPFPVTSQAVHDTCTQHPDSQLQYATFAGVTHVPLMFASQRLWLNFIEARFTGTADAKGCRRSNYTSARPYQYYQKEQNWFIEFATNSYQTA